MQYTNQINFINMSLPEKWKEIPSPAENVRAFSNRNGLHVIIGIEKDDKGNRWLHVSLSRSVRLPKYGDICHVKDVFIGVENKAIQVFPPNSQKVNIHRFTLHLFSAMDEDPLPDFRNSEGML